MTKLIVGIGNPGKEYENTRHNIGYVIIDNYLKEDNWSKKHNSMVKEKNINGEKVIFIKPLTYVNESGLEVSYYKNYYQINDEDILVIHDDISLPLGVIRLKINSSAGGHNGIKSIIKELNSISFIQLKIGVSLNKDIDLKDYVLGKFNTEEKKSIDVIKEITYNVLSDFIHGETLDVLMNKYN